MATMNSTTARRELTLQEAAAKLGVSYSTALRMTRDGRLKVTVRRPRTQVRVMVSAASVTALERKLRQAEEAQAK